MYLIRINKRFGAAAGTETWIMEKSSLTAGYASLLQIKPGSVPVFPDTSENHKQSGDS